MSSKTTELHALEQKWLDKANELMRTGSVNMMIKADAIRDCATDLRLAANEIDRLAKAGA